MMDDYKRESIYGTNDFGEYEFNTEEGVFECLYVGRWMNKDNGDLRCNDYHHDGTNHYLYRVWKDNISEAQKDNLRLKLYKGEFSRADITRSTKRLGDEIGKVYGWTFPERKEQRSYER